MATCFALADVSVSPASPHVRAGSLESPCDSTVCLPLHACSPLCTMHRLSFALPFCELMRRDKHNAQQRKRGQQSSSVSCSNTSAELSAFTLLPLSESWHVEPGAPPSHLQGAPLTPGCSSFPSALPPPSAPSSPECSTLGAPPSPRCSSTTAAHPSPSSLRAPRAYSAKCSQAEINGSYFLFTSPLCSPSITGSLP